MADDRSMLGRILAVIDVCVDSDDPVPLTELAEAAGLPKATAWRIARSLTERGLLQRGPRGYAGGAGLAAIGSRVADQMSLRGAVTPYLAELHARTGAAVWAVDVRSDRAWPIIATIYDHRAADTRYAESWQHSPRDPAILASALGILALAEKPDDADVLLRDGVPRLTPHTEVRSARVEALLGEARRSREVVEHERFRLGWSCLAVPVVDPHSGDMVGVLGAVERTPRFAADRLLRAAHSAAESVGRALPVTA